MPFDISKFQSASFIHREEDVVVKDLHDFFPDGEEPIIRVRGLNGEELASVHEAMGRNKNLSKLMDGLLSSYTQDKLEAIKETLGFTNKTPGEIAKRLEMLILGAVNPVFTMDMAVKFCKVWPIEFYTVTNTISKLTGQGMLPGKPNPSGKTHK